jgi:hypothetical protein
VPGCGARTFRLGEAVGFEFAGIVILVAADEQEIAVVGDKNPVVVAPVFRDLRAIGGEPGIVLCGLDLDDAAFGTQARNGFLVFGLLKLVGCVEAKVGVPGAGIRDPANASHLRLEGLADPVEEIFEGAVIGLLGYTGGGGADFVKVFEIGFERVHVPSSFAANVARVMIGKWEMFCTENICGRGELGAEWAGAGGGLGKARHRRDG